MAPRDIHGAAATFDPDACCSPAETHACVGSIPDAAFSWLLGSLCGLYRIPFDPLLVRASFPGQHDRGSLASALEALGLSAQPVPLQQIAATDRFCVAFLKPREAEGPAEPAIVSATDDGGISYFGFNDGRPRGVPREQLSGIFEPTALKITPIVAGPSDPDALAQRARFGFRWFVPELLKHRRLWYGVLAASLVIQVLALGLPLFTQAIVDKVVLHRTESTLIAIGIGLAMFLVFSSVLTWIRQHLVLHTGMRVDAVLGSSVFRHLLELPPRYFQMRPTGVIAARLQGVEQIRDFLASAAVSLVLDLPFLSIALAIMFWYSTSLTALALAFLAAIVAASMMAAPLFRARLDREFLLGARTQAFVTEYVAGMDTVKSLQMEPQLARRYGDFLAAQLKAGFATRQMGNTYQVVAQTLEQGMTVAILIVGAWIVMQPHSAAEDVFTIGMLVAFQMFAARLSQPVMRLVGLWQQFQQARLAVRRLGDLMDVPAEPYSVRPTRGRGQPRTGEVLIEVEHLAYRHGDDRPFLYEDLCFAVRFGECLEIRGSSGCGKSTLAKLLQGFYLPTRGRIRVGGIDTRHLSANELRATFGVVPQETVLFAGTILENLQLAHPAASFEQVVAACRMAEIHDVIEQLPQGYATPIGERGAGLSGGQRQRLAIARALLKRPRVLIFDEAAANLDPPTAENIAVTINALRGRLTVLVISHAPLCGLAVDRVIDLAAASGAPTGLGPRGKNDEHHA